MIVIMKAYASDAELNEVLVRIEEEGLEAHLSRGQARTIVGVIGKNGRLLDREVFERMAGVERVVRVQKPYKLAGRDFHPEDTTFRIGNVNIGGSGVVIMAGPCSVESRTQIIETAYAVKEAGAHVLRGRRLQAAFVALQLPGTGPGRA